MFNDMAHLESAYDRRLDEMAKPAIKKPKVEVQRKRTYTFDTQTLRELVAAYLLEHENLQVKPEDLTLSVSEPDYSDYYSDTPAKASFSITVHE